MPGVAVAREMQKLGWSVSWIGTEVGMEGRLVAGAGYDFDALSFTGMRGKGLSHAVKGAFRLAASVWRARKILKERRAGAVFTTGGYIALPVAIAAKSCGLDVFAMNCDAQMLLSIRLIAPLARRIFCGFEGPCASRSGAKALVTGNPVRSEILRVPGAADRMAGREGPLRLLVFGGSLGARVLNETVPAALAKFAPAQRPSVVHQCGAKHLDETRSAYDRAGVTARIVPFIEDMAGAYAASDLVVCRSGATSVSELAAAGMPSVLVPFVASTTSHQVGNARFMQQAGAAVTLAQGECTPERLHAVLSGLDRRALVKMGNSARALARPEAAREAARAIEGAVK